MTATMTMELTHGRTTLTRDKHPDAVAKVTIYYYHFRDTWPDGELREVEREVVWYANTTDWTEIFNAAATGYPVETVNVEAFPHGRTDIAGRYRTYGAWE